MIMKITKTAVALIVLILWAIFSLGYIGITTWNQFKATKMAQAYQQGRSQAFFDIADEVNKCAPTGVPIELGKDKDGKNIIVPIVGVSCLQQAASAEKSATQPAPVAPKK
jgi:hypothetical protein